MTQAEYKRSHNAGSRKIVVITLLVLVLCLTCFALGIMVGGSGSEDAAEEYSQQASASVSVRKTPEAAPAEAKDEDRVQVATQQKPMSVAEPVAELDQTEEVGVAQKTPAKDVERAVQEIALGSGINPRKETVAAPEGETAKAQAEQTGAESQVQAQADASALPQASSEAAPEQKEVTAVTRVAAEKKGDYVVQVASFRREPDARSLAQKLNPDFPAFVNKVELGEKGTWFRVLVGPWVERERAEEVKRMIMQSKNMKGFVKRAP